MRRDNHPNTENDRKVSTRGIEPTRYSPPPPPPPEVPDGGIGVEKNTDTN